MTKDLGVESSEPAPAVSSDFPAAAGPAPELMAELRDALARGAAERVRALVVPLGAADVADLLEALDADKRAGVLEAVGPGLDPVVLVELAPDIRDEVVTRFDAAGLADACARLDADDALYLVESLPPVRRREVLAAVPDALRQILEEGLRFPPDSAGRLMRRDVVAVPSFWRVAEVQEFLRGNPAVPDEFYDVFIVDPRHRPVGAVAPSQLLRRPLATPMRDIAEAHPVVMPATLDREDVAEAFRRRDLVSAPVVDRVGRLVGVITVDDVVDIIDEEAEEDLMRLGGVGASDFHAPPIATARRRVRWLIVTLVNTLLAASVIGWFQESIERLVALAVLMPIVAAMGGNAGMQVVTVMVRALATREAAPGTVVRTVGKELAVGALNGAVFALILAAVASFWFRDAGLALVLAMAMLINMIWAGVAGTIIPLGLARIGVDPALAAGPFLTTTTDVLGFLVFLGLGTAFLL